MPAPAPSGLDGNQVLQHAFIDATGELRVAATISPSGSEVIIDHTNDSIRLGDGSNFLTSTTVGAEVGLDVNIINTSLPVSITVDSPDTPKITNITIPVANTEQSHIFAANTKRILMRLRGIGKLQYSFTSGQSGTSFITMKKGNSEEFNALDLSVATTIYFQSPKAGETLEILEWS